MTYVLTTITMLVANLMSPGQSIPRTPSTGDSGVSGLRAHQRMSPSFQEQGQGPTKECYSSSTFRLSSPSFATTVSHAASPSPKMRGPNVATPRTKSEPEVKPKPEGPDRVQVSEIAVFRRSGGFMRTLYDITQVPNGVEDRIMNGVNGRNVEGEPRPPGEDDRTVDERGFFVYTGKSLFLSTFSPTSHIPHLADLEVEFTTKYIRWTHAHGTPSEIHKVCRALAEKACIELSVVCLTEYTCLWKLPHHPLKSIQTAVKHLH